VVLLVVDVSAQILLQGLVLALGLIVSLWMVCGAELLVDMQVMAKCLEEFQSELGPMIRSDAMQYTHTP
jgi:ABC-type glucose/galactose transport system permease subunit